MNSELAVETVSLANTVDLDEHIRMCSWQRLTWLKRPAISCYELID